MKRRIISASTAAVLAAATMNVPAIVSYAATSSTDAFFVDCGVTVIDSIENSKNVLVPVTVDKDITISSASLTFEVFTRNSFDTATITGVDNLASKDFTVTCKDNVVTLTASKDVTIKKGSKLFDLKMDMKYITSKKNGKVVEATEITSNRFMSIKLKAFSAKDSSGNTFTLSENCLNNTVGEIITTAKINKDASISIGNVVSSSRKVEVPVSFTGKVGVGIIGFKVSKNAKIVSVNPETKNLHDPEANNTSLVLNEIKGKEESEQYTEFKNTQICTLTIEVPSSAQTGDTFEVQVNHMDLSSVDGNYSISSVAKGVVTYKGTASSETAEYLKGDVNFDGMVDAEDATYILKYSNMLSAIDLAELMGRTADVTDDLKNAITRNAPAGADIEELYKLASEGEIGDVNGDGSVDPTDATYIQHFCNKRDLKLITVDELTKEEEEEIWNSLIKK